MIGIKPFPKGLESREETRYKVQKILYYCHVKKPLHVVKCKRAVLASQREAEGYEKALKAGPHLTALQRLPAPTGRPKKQEKTFKSCSSLLTASWLK